MYIKWILISLEKVYKTLNRRRVNWFTFPSPSAALNLVLPPRSWGSSRWGSSCAVLHIRPLQGGTHVGRWELCSRPGMCGALHRTGVRSEDHQQGQMQRQGKQQTKTPKAKILLVGLNVAHVKDNLCWKLHKSSSFKDNWKPVNLFNVNKTKNIKK